MTLKTYLYKDIKMDYKEIRQWVSKLSLEGYTRHILTDMLHAFEVNLYTAGALCFRPLLTHILFDNSDQEYDVEFVSKLNYDKVVDELQNLGYDAESARVLKDEVNQINHSFKKGDSDLSEKITEEVIKILEYFYG